MDLLGGYTSDASASDQESESSPQSKSTATAKCRPINRNALNAAPTPKDYTTIRSIMARRDGNLHSSSTDISGPLQGPAEMDPYGPKPQSRGEIGTSQKNYQVGEMDFRKQRNLFERTGKALAPSSIASENDKSYVESSDVANESWNMKTKKRRRVDLDAQTKEKESLVHDSDDEQQYGIWAPPSRAEKALLEDQTTQIDLAGGPQFLSAEQIEERKYVEERNRQRGLQNDASALEHQNFDRMVERKMSHLLPPRMDSEDPTPFPAKTTFHGKEEFNYKGQSWMVPPAATPKNTNEGTGLSDHTCYVPKKCVHRFTGHNKGVQRIRLFPQTGHLLLSAGLDHKVKIWSIPEKQVMRTYIGHSAAVRDVAFNNTGTQFASASYDRFLRLWDTKSGKVLQTFTNRRVPYVVKFYPKDNDFMVVGCSDNKVVTYNIHTAEITQEYNHHLAPVNTITFVEDGARMLTSSDDKKILLWEWDIGVPIKYISDPTLHSMPVVTLHPSLKYWVGQGLDNEIKVYEATGKMSMQKRKKFSGHQVAGYACDIAISPDGRFVVSGDGSGKLFFWDWRMHKILQKYNAHDKGPTIACIWHPTIPSTVFTCGWDGVIKMWE